MFWIQWYLLQHYWLGTFVQKCDALRIPLFMFFSRISINSWLSQLPSTNTKSKNGFRETESSERHKEITAQDRRTQWNLNFPAFFTSYDLLRNVEKKKVNISGVSGMVPIPNVSLFLTSFWGDKNILLENATNLWNCVMCSLIYMKLLILELQGSMNYQLAF